MDSITGASMVFMLIFSEKLKRLLLKTKNELLSLKIYFLFSKNLTLRQNIVSALFLFFRYQVNIWQYLTLCDLFYSSYKIFFH